ncbi:hypothetical protein Lesp01_46690 [Lentzea sp. NBRC 102530]|nr:hypothetical protein Lesp01_46690 [Lentzea sp. NBRC 102530]
MSLPILTVLRVCGGWHWLPLYPDLPRHGGKTPLHANLYGYRLTYVLPHTLVRARAVVTAPQRAYGHVFQLNW